MNTSKKNTSKKNTNQYLWRYTYTEKEIGCGRVGEWKLDLHVAFDEIKRSNCNVLEYFI